MVFAKVVLGLPIEGPFDYLVPKDLEARIKLGVRCSIPFRNKRKVGFIVGISRKSSIVKVKPIYNIIDELPILSNDMLKLTREVAHYYFCSWGEAIEIALPESLRLPKAVNIEPLPPLKYRQTVKSKHHTILIHDLNSNERWKIYLEKINESINADKGVIFLTPYIESAIEVQKILKTQLNQDIALLHSQQNTKDSISEWQKIKNNQAKIVVGTRLAVFSPVYNLGLIIVDNEADQSFKQDQSPHYHARDVAFMRARLSKADLLLGSICPSLETFYLAKRKKVKYIFFKKKEFPEIKIIDMSKIYFDRRKKYFLSPPLQDILNSALERKEKIIIFSNRKGFATYAVCPNCQKVQRCPRCNVNLVYHFKEGRLICHYCNYKTEPPKLCPNCNAAYIRYSGMGTEKIESELSRLYPKARILIASRESKITPTDIDILIATSFIFRYPPINFDLIAIISIDNSLNRIDLRAAEKTFSCLLQLIALAPKRLIIQTFYPGHYCFNAIKNLDVNLFYRKELTFRKQLDFPPFSHMAVVKVRGRNQDKVRAETQSLFDRLRKFNKDKTIKIISCFPGQPSKLRGNFYWQILIKFKDIDKLAKFLKRNLKDYRRWGIIVTVDVDPF